jgi:cold shock CspA family protein
MAQGTIKTWSKETRSGVILDDARKEIPFEEDSYRASGIRELRLGQRVKFDLVEEGAGAKVRNLTIVSF